MQFNYTRLLELFQVQYACTVLDRRKKEFLMSVFLKITGEGSYLELRDSHLLDPSELKNVVEVRDEDYLLFREYLGAFAILSNGTLVLNPDYTLSKDGVPERNQSQAELPL